MQSEYSLESLNSAAFTKPNKHKTNSKDFSTTWPNLFPNTFTTVGEFKRLLQNFFSNRFSRHDGTVLPVPVTSTVRAQAPLRLPHVLFDTTNLHKILPNFQFQTWNLAKTLQVFTRDFSLPCGDRATSDAQEKLLTGGGVCKDLSCQKAGA